MLCQTSVNSDLCDMALNYIQERSSVQGISYDINNKLIELIGS